MIILATIGEKTVVGIFGATGYSERTHFSTTAFLFLWSCVPPHGGAEGGLLLHRRGERSEGRRKSADTAPHAPASLIYVEIMRPITEELRRGATTLIQWSVAVMRFSAEQTRPRSTSYY